MCSQACSRKPYINQCQLNVEWHTPDEEDTDDESENFLTSQRISMPADLRRVLQETPTTKRVRTSRISGYSLQDKTKGWHRSSIYNRDGEENAVRYSRMVTEDSLKHLHDTIRIAGAIAEKGNDINEELARQDRGISRSEEDILWVEYETAQTAKVLKGMGSLRGKLSNVLGRKGPKLNVIPSGNMDMDLMSGVAGFRSPSQLSNCKSAILSQGVTEDMHQKQINKGIANLHQVLDNITVQQMDAAWMLNQNEERLSVYEGQLSKTHQKINCQSEIIKKLMGS